MFFFCAWPVSANDVNEPVEYCLVSSFLCVVQVPRDGLAGAGMTSLQSEIELPYSFRIAKSLFRDLVVLPPDRESLFGSTEATSKNIVECIQVLPPRRQMHHAIDLTKELFER